MPKILEKALFFIYLFELLPMISKIFLFFILKGYKFLILINITSFDDNNFTPNKLRLKIQLKKLQKIMPKMLLLINLYK